VDGAKEMSEAKAAIVMCDYRAKQEGVPTIYDAILGEDWHCFKLADTYKKCEVLKHGDKRKKAEEFMWTNRVPENAKYYLSMKDYKENITLDEYWYKIRKAMEQKVICETKEIGEYCAVYSNMHEGNSLL
jgi:hypothetical protein